MKQLYNVECERNNVSPKEFWNYCKKQCEKQNFEIESFADYETWENPAVKEEYHVNTHEDWDVPQRESIKYMPFDIQIYLQNTYNFIIEFDFDTDKKGHGYFFATETRQ